jgi:hypothetical protein
MKSFAVIILLCLYPTHSTLTQEGWSWQNPLPQGNKLTEIFFINEQTGWAFGENGIISIFP